LRRQWQEKAGGVQDDDNLSSNKDCFPSLLFRVVSGENVMLGHLSGYDFEQFQENLKTWLNSGKTEWLVHGNFTK